MSEKKKGKIGNLVSKVKHIARDAKEKIRQDLQDERQQEKTSWKFSKDESSSTSDQSSMPESIQVPRDVARAWGYFMWTPLETQFREASGLSMMKSTLHEAEGLSHHLGITGETHTSGPSTDRKDSHITQQKLKRLSMTREDQQEHERAADFLVANTREAREMGEMMGTTSPRVTSTLTGRSSRVSKGDIPNPVDFLRAHVKEARQRGLELGTASPQLSRKMRGDKEDVKSYGGNRGDVKSYGGNVNLYGGNPACRMASDFLRRNVGEARTMGERMGTVSPVMKETKRKEQKPPQKKWEETTRKYWKEEETSPTHKDRTREHPHEKERDKGYDKGHGEKRGHREDVGVAPSGGSMKEQMSGRTEESRRDKGYDKGHGEKRHGGEKYTSFGPEFLKMHLDEARAKGEQMGTTSPRVGGTHTRIKSKDKPKDKSKDFSKEKFTETAPFEFLRDNLEEVRRMGEKMGTTSPRVGKSSATSQKSPIILS